MHGGPLSGLSVKRYRSRIPLDPQDLEIGLEEFAAEMLRYDLLPGVTVEQLRNQLLDAFGYDAATADANCPIEDLPEHAQELCGLISWRLFADAGLPLGATVRAVDAAWNLQCLSVNGCYPGGVGIRQDLSHWHPLPTCLPEPVAAEIAAALHAREDGPTDDGRFAHKGALGLVEATINENWDGDSRIPPDRLRAEIRLAGITSYTYMLGVRTHDAHPRGMEMVTFRDGSGRALGHGFRWCEADALLSYVYPPDDKLGFIQAHRAIWARQALPQPPNCRLPDLLFVTEFDGDEAFFDDLPSDWSNRLAEAVQQAAYLDPVPTHNGRVDLGFTFNFEGAPYTRRPRAWSKTRIESALGCRLLSPDDNSAGQPTAPLVLYALSADEHHLIVSIDFTLRALAEAESADMKREPVRAEFHRLVESTIPAARPCESKASASLKGGAFAVGTSWAFLPQRFASPANPILQQVPLEHLRDYAYDIWGKSGLDHRKYLKPLEAINHYVLLRNAGIDPLQIYRRRDWTLVLALGRTARLALPDLVASHGMSQGFMRLSHQLRAIHQMLLEIDECVESILDGWQGERLPYAAGPESMEG